MRQRHAPLLPLSAQQEELLPLLRSASSALVRRTPTFLLRRASTQATSPSTGDNPEPLLSGPQLLVAWNHLIFGLDPSVRG
ncbi:hypothetical protein ZWY2020_057267 [Hordeum vulgare]|nr:hypothetical protein ZWY2020_057267 [Hordeum vulgare]